MKSRNAVRSRRSSTHKKEKESQSSVPMKCRRRERESSVCQGQVRQERKRIQRVPNGRIKDERGSRVFTKGQEEKRRLQSMCLEGKSQQLAQQGMRHERGARLHTMSQDRTGCKKKERVSSVPRKCPSGKQKRPQEKQEAPVRPIKEAGMKEAPTESSGASSVPKKRKRKRKLLRKASKDSTVPG